MTLYHNYIIIMTYKEIRQFAEEFMKAVPESWPYDSDALTTIEIAEDVIAWLAEDNYLVPKSKVEYEVATSHYCDDDADIASIVSGQMLKRLFGDNIFGSQLGKEAEK